jgi:hypothetical protein
LIPSVTHMRKQAVKWETPSRHSPCPHTCVQPVYMLPQPPPLHLCPGHKACVRYNMQRVCTSAGCTCTCHHTSIAHVSPHMCTSATSVWHGTKHSHPSTCLAHKQFRHSIDNHSRATPTRSYTVHSYTGQAVHTTLYTAQSNKHTTPASSMLTWDPSLRSCGFPTQCWALLQCTAAGPCTTWDASSSILSHSVSPSPTLSAWCMYVPRRPPVPLL